MELHEKKFEVVSYPLNGLKDLRELPFYPETVEYSTPKMLCVILVYTSAATDLGLHILRRQSKKQGR